MMMSLVRCVTMGLLGLLGMSAMADESRPIYIELKETAAHHYQLQWKIPPSVPLFNLPTVSLPNVCESRSPMAEFAGGDGLVRRRTYECSGPLAEHAVLIAYPANPSVSSLIRYDTISGEHHIVVLSPHQLTWVVPATETALGVARQYTRLGMEHIWSGVDHLLFLVCLLWIAGSWRRMMVTVTGFTLAHSVTLVLSALGFVKLAVAPVEASIALSILFLATEIVKGPRQSLTWRYPIAVSSSFGLLHGFGFAAALTDIGLPQTEVMTGLLLFNVGVEIGQLLFVVGIAGLMRGVQWLWSKQVMIVLDGDRVRRGVGYALGALTAFWFVERGLAIVAA